MTPEELKDTAKDIKVCPILKSTLTLTFEYKPCTRSTKGDKFNHPSPPTSLCTLNNCPSPPYLLYSPGRFGKLSWLYFYTFTFTIDDVISFFGQELSYKILPKAMKCLLQHHRHQPKKKRFSVKIPFFLFVSLIRVTKLLSV